MGRRSRRLDSDRKIWPGWGFGLVALLLAAVAVVAWSYLPGLFESKDNIGQAEIIAREDSPCNMGVSDRENLNSVSGITWQQGQSGTDIGYVKDVGPGVVTKAGAPRCFEHSRAGMALAAMNIWQAWDSSARPDVVKFSVSGPNLSQARQITTEFDQSKLDNLAVRGGTRVFAYRVSSYGRINGVVELLSETPMGMTAYVKMPMEFTGGDWHWRMIFDENHFIPMGEIDIDDTWTFVRIGDGD